MTNKFDNVGVDEGTVILNSTITKFGNYDVLHQTWTRKDVSAESLVFFTEDIAGISEKDLKDHIYISDLVKVGCTDITVSKGETYTVFHFNFNVEHKQRNL